MKESPETGNIMETITQSTEQNTTNMPDVCQEYDTISPIAYDEREHFMKSHIAECGHGVRIRSPFYAETDKLVLGTNVLINHNCQIYNKNATVYIGSNTMISGNCVICTADDTKASYLGKTDYPFDSCDIHIGERVWIGANVFIGPSVHIGNNATIGAGAIVLTDVPEGEVWAGAPAHNLHEPESAAIPTDTITDDVVADDADAIAISQQLIDGNRDAYETIAQMPFMDAQLEDSPAMVAARKLMVQASSSQTAALQSAKQAAMHAVSQPEAHIASQQAITEPSMTSTSSECIIELDDKPDDENTWQSKEPNNEQDSEPQAEQQHTETPAFREGTAWFEADMQLYPNLSDSMALMCDAFNKLNPADNASKERFLKEYIMHCGDNVEISQPFYIDNVKLDIDDNVSIGNNVQIYNRFGVVHIDDNAIINGNSILCATDHSLNPYARRTPPEKDCSIHIGKNAWIGPHAFIGPGVNIGDNAVIEANAVVLHDVPTDTIYGGISAHNLESFSDDDSEENMQESYETVADFDAETLQDEISDQYANNDKVILSYNPMMPEECLSSEPDSQTADSTSSEQNMQQADWNAYSYEKNSTIYQELRGYSELICKAFNMLKPSDYRTRERFLKERILSCGNDTSISSPLHFSTPKLDIGSNVIIKPNCQINNRYGTVHISDGAIIGGNCVFYAEQHDTEHRQQTAETDCSIFIGRNALIGHDTAIYAGVHIGDNAIIKSGSVVRADVPADTVYAGSPEHEACHLHETE